MTATERRKGASWEAQLAGLLRRRGWTHAERTAGGRLQPRGDLLGVPGWHLEAKNHQAHQLGAWATRAAADAASWRWALLIKRARHPNPEDGYAVLSVGAFLRLLDEAGYQ